MLDSSQPGTLLLLRLRKLLLVRAPTFFLTASPEKASPGRQRAGSQIHFRVEAPSGCVLAVCDWDASRMEKLTDADLLKELQQGLESKLDATHQQLMALHQSYDPSGNPYDIPPEQRERYHSLFRQRQELEHLLAALSPQEG